MIKHFFFLTALLVVNLSEAQNLMQLPSGLETATPMQVRWKSGIGFPRYEFGSYRLINGKEKWTGTSTETDGGFLHDLLSNMREVRENVHSKRSFQLINNLGDTVTVNMAITTVKHFEQYKKGLLGNHYENQHFEGAYTTWIAAIETKDGTQAWMLTAFQEEKAGFLFNKISPLDASMMNDSTEFEVFPVNHYANGKKAWEVLGFVIVEDGVPLAAVQFRGENPLKQHLQNFIWLSPTLDPKSQLILATSLTALLTVGHDVYYGDTQE